MSRKSIVLAALLYHFGSQPGSAALPRYTLPEGLELVAAVAPPLVRHPLMGCVDPQGALYLGDAAGLNLNKAELETQLPNRVLKLVDENADGVYDRATVFADKMTFPQGACWHEGALYVASPPGIWRLRDTDGDGVAEERTMIVGGFDYTGNAADIHGPFLHPNGRLYWCHGRKGHRVVQGADGALVHEGLASGIWSCQPDGSDVRWHSLGCADNPTEIDFTPEGDVIGTCNLYHSQPRGDTLMHWLEGGVYERADMMKAITGMPRTLEHMPVIHNFGHVAVSGCTFDRTGALFPASPGRHTLFVTHFNTQRVVRMELEPLGSTYKAVEREFLKIHDPEAHLTDVIEDRDGSLLVLDTGGWFRIGCPSSLMAKPDVTGAVYRIRKSGSGAQSTRLVQEARPPSPGTPWIWQTEEEVRAALTSGVPSRQRMACDALARRADLKTLLEPLKKLLASEVDPALEHAGIRALAALTSAADLLSSGGSPANDRLRSREVRAANFSRIDGSGPAADRAAYSVRLVSLASGLGNDQPMTKEAALFGLDLIPEAVDANVATFQEWLQGSQLAPGQSAVVERVLKNRLGNPAAAQVLARMLAHSDAGTRRLALQIAAQSTAVPSVEGIIAPLLADLTRLAAPGAAGKDTLPVLLGVVQRLKSPQFDPVLESLAADDAQPSSLRLKALAALSSSGGAVRSASFDLLSKAAADPVNIAARIEAVRMLAAARLTDTQLAAVLAELPMCGPLELAEWLKGLRKYGKPDQGRLIARALAASPALGSIEESTVRTLCSDWPADVFAGLRPSLEKAHDAIELKKRRLEVLATLVKEKGRPQEGGKLFETGRGTCVACHQVAGLGRAIGPDLSHIGAIRQERDLLESILFPSATLARDYETHAIETSDGESHMGLIRSHTAEGLLLVDLAGQEKSLAHDRISAQTTLTTSLMPMGLDMTMSEQELCDLVAWLCSRK